MNQTQVQKIMEQAFSGRTPEQKENLLFHVESGTTIMCGKSNAKYFIDKLGGG